MVMRRIALRYICFAVFILRSLGSTTLSAQERVAVSTIIESLESTKIESAIVDFELFESIFGELPEELASFIDPSIPQPELSPNSTCQLFYNAKLGARYTNITQKLQHNVLNKFEVILEKAYFRSGRDEPGNVAHSATKRTAWDQPIVFGLPPVSMIMSWLDPMATPLFEALNNQSNTMVAITTDAKHGEVVTIDVPEQQARVVLAKSLAWRPVLIERMRDEELSSLTTYIYGRNSNVVVVADSIHMELKSPSGRDATYHVDVKECSVSELEVKDIEIEYPAYTLLEIEDESTQGGWRYFVSSSSGQLRELTSASQMDELNATGGWRKFADGEYSRSWLLWYFSPILAAVCVFVAFKLKRR